MGTPQSSRGTPHTHAHTYDVLRRVELCGAWAWSTKGVWHRFGSFWAVSSLLWSPKDQSGRTHAHTHARTHANTQCTLGLIQRLGNDPGVCVVGWGEVGPATSTSHHSWDSLRSGSAVMTWQLAKNVDARLGDKCNRSCQRCRGLAVEVGARGWRATPPHRTETTEQDDPWPLCNTGLTV